jgi:hypothetical protein
MIVRWSDKGIGGFGVEVWEERKRGKYNSRCPLSLHFSLHKANLSFLDTLVN